MNALDEILARFAGNVLVDECERFQREYTGETTADHLETVTGNPDASAPEIDPADMTWTCRFCDGPIETPETICACERRAA